MQTSDAAIAGLYLAHAGELHGFARRRVGRQEAEDLVQEAYLHLLQQGKAANLEQPRAYLFRIAANLAVDLARRTKIRARYIHAVAVEDGAAPSPDAWDPGMATLQVMRLEAALASLPPVCRNAFVLSRVQGLTHAEIAEELGVSARTIDRHVAKASEHLRGYFAFHN
ncbi:MAG TPA: sigma-70 family RNA polymerase sigma factor [Methylocella sp.]|nr:sigma-70 family RNA polymerase sigma factor [Methylocella sp.]